MQRLCLFMVPVLLLVFSADSLAADKEVWQPISAGVLSKVKPGYPGKTAGVAVDTANGDVYMCVPDQGL